MSLSTLLRMDTRSAHLHETEIIPLVMRGRGVRKTYIFACERVYIGLFGYYALSCELVKLPPPTHLELHIAHFKSKMRKRYID